jgi:hypothetical protein
MAKLTLQLGGSYVDALGRDRPPLRFEGGSVFMFNKHFRVKAGDAEGWKPDGTLLKPGPGFANLVALKGKGAPIPTAPPVPPAPTAAPIPESRNTIYLESGKHYWMHDESIKQVFLVPGSSPPVYKETPTSVDGWGSRGGHMNSIVNPRTSLVGEVPEFIVSLLRKHGYLP